MKNKCAAMKVPLDQILHSKNSFPSANLSFEVELSAASTQLALQFCSAAFCDAKLDLRSFRINDHGTAICKLRLLPQSELDQLDRAIADEAGIYLVRWTTLISFGG